MLPFTGGSRNSDRAIGLESVFQGEQRVCSCEQNVFSGEEAAHARACARVRVGGFGASR